jgi:cytochrome c peroxidase
VVRGFRAFFDQKLDGLGSNGRACSDCHMASKHFQLTPAAAEARFRRLQVRRKLNPLADGLSQPLHHDRRRGQHSDRSAEIPGNLAGLRTGGARCKL